jgi:uncharacterized protein YqgC (DUF456 family)
VGYIIPSGTNNSGGSMAFGNKYGLGCLVFLSSFGFLIGAFGALMGILYDSKITNTWKAAVGSFIGFLAASFIQF